MQRSELMPQTDRAPDVLAARPDATQAVRSDGSVVDGPEVASRAGGVAAVVQAATFVFGFAIYGTVIASGDYANPAVAAVRHVAFLADNQVVLQAWYTVIYLVFGAALVVLAPAVGDRLRSHTPTLARAATVFGLIWATLMFAAGMTAIIGGDMVVALHGSDPAQAAALWTTVNLVIEGLGGGIELVGGSWIFLTGIAGLRARVFPTWLNRIGVIAGAAGIASTALVATDIVTSVFGLGCIVWFAWLGAYMLRTGRSDTVDVR